MRSTLVAAFLLWPALARGAENAVDFKRDVQPIFQARCTRCHGAEQQRSQLRLDSRTGALRGGMSGAVVLPGDSRGSALFQRITGVLQPSMPFEGSPLPAEEIARIQTWIDAGAPGAVDAEPPDQRHWAYRKPVRPEPPAVANAAWIRNPIDRFVLARLEREGLTPAPEANRETLIRRVSLDLVGLPPTLAEVDAFLADTSPDAYEKVVDRLLASPHYGERWARPWLDLARYADTNGYEKDRRRSAWMYRDWVIDALNQDLSFRDFTIQQIAGDMLPGATTAQKIATGFHRNTLLNQEGGIDVEEARWETLVDRVNTTAFTWLGSTVACAQCHNHKFDPISQKDYYRMMAFFDNAEYRVQGLGEVVTDKWIVEPDLELAPPEVLKKRDALKAEAEALKKTIDASDLGAEIAAWETALESRPPRWIVLRPVRFTSAYTAALEKKEDGSLLVSGPKPERDTYTVTVRTPGAAITALRLEALPDPSLPASGPGRSSSGNFVLTRLGVRAGPETIPLVRAVADFSEDGRSVAQAIDESEDSGWSIDGQQGRAHTAVFLPGKPIRAGGGTLTVTLEHTAGSPGSTLGRFRLSATSSANPWGGIQVPEEIRKILDTAPMARTAEQTKVLTDYYRPLAASLDAPRARLAAVRRELEAIQIPTAMVLRERAGSEPPSTLLRVRGSYMSPGERVYAATPAFLPPIPEGRPRNRLGLAYWLVDEENPLTARVAVNRSWEQLFGRGLVLTSEDFGTQGEPPTHPELLDWLATTFTSQGWSAKKLHRLMVTSATYRQSSRATPALLERDPYNRLLARGPRFRVEAETVRDIALAVSGLLSPKVGGPSVFPDQPDGVWDNPYSKDKWTLSEGDDRYRRSLYTFVRRTAPYPMLTTFDAPSREFCTVRRVRTNTPLQALTTLNDPAFFAAAKALAGRVLREAGPEPEARAVQVFRLATARRPSEAELAPLIRFYRDEAARSAGDDAAAWTMVANVVLNLDETMTKE
ncbi:MAG TPA: PSD1 and planctomycete cytochrome C domain-containing protein [Vicinamibacteria bacterium]|nr:PSD1 and planctomycete cytochrome C domain-containing protein [Vicinamibacteria bacterium]